MKKLYFLAILFCIGCSKCFTDTSNKPPKKQISNAPHVKNQVILDAQGLGAEYGDVKKFLEDNGFKKLDSCNCSHSIELWKSDQDVDVIGKIGDASSGGAGVMSGQAWRLTPNFILTPALNISREGQQEFRKPFQKATGNKVRVAIIDTGVDSTSGYVDKFLWRRNGSSSCVTEGVLGLNASSITQREPLDIQGHGTHINGIISGMPPNSGNQDSAKLELLNIKFTTDATGTGDLFKAVCGMYYALDKGVEVMNLSWGYAGGEAPDLIKSFLETAKSKNVVIVAGAGNFKGDNDTLKFWPASFSEKYDFVISVGGYDGYSNPLKLYDMTNFGNTVSVFAPGVNVKSAYLGASTTAISSGTSMAAAYVSRVAAILKANNPTLSATDIKKIIVNNSAPQVVDGKNIRKFVADAVITAGSI